MRPTSPLAFVVVWAVSAAGADPRQSKEIYRWTGPSTGVSRLQVRNLNGPVQVRAASGQDLDVRARVEWSAGANPDALMVLRKGSGADLTFCVARKSRPDVCDREGLRDVSVAFEVTVPAGPSLEIATVNGGIKASNLAGEVSLATTNGAIEATNRAGRVSIQSANGSISATLGPSMTRANLQTVNGSIHVTRATSAGADVTASTVHGRVVTEGRVSSPSFRGHVGPAGGVRLQAATVNGSIEIVAR